MSEGTTWLQLLEGEVSTEEAGDLLTRGVAHLDDFLKSDPRTTQRVVDILGRRLTGEMKADTWQVMHASLSQYFTEELAYMLYWVVGVEDPLANRMEQVAKDASRSVMAFLRVVVGVYGADLANAFALWRQVPDNWRNFYREVYYDLIEHRHHIRVNILKYNGEEILIEGPPNFVLNLARALIYTARLVGTREAFSQSNIDLFVDEARQLTDLLTAEKEEAPAEPSELTTS